MAKRVYVTGIGVISAIGNNVEENLESLKSEKSGLKPIQILETIHQSEYLVGEITLKTDAICNLLGIDDKDLYPRTSLLAIKAAVEAVNHAGVKMNDGVKTGVIVGTSVGGMDITEKYYYTPELNSTFIKCQSCGYTTGQVASYLGVKDMIITQSTACSSGANAIAFGARLIKHGIVDRVVAGGADSLSKFTLNGFKTLMILSPEACKPFDKNRQGLSLGEGAGFVVLESEDLVKKSGKKVLAEVTGYANANDAYHPTATSPDATGPYLCMKEAMDMANLNAENIDYVNTHGTGTENNDLTEGIALKRLFNDNVPPFSSTKAFTGHTLGASGGIETVFSVLAIQHQLLLPNLFFEEPIEELDLVPQKRISGDKKIEHVMSNSFGFGGSDSSLIISSVK